MERCPDLASEFCIPLKGPELPGKMVDSKIRAGQYKISLTLCWKIREGSKNDGDPPKGKASLKGAPLAKAGTIVEQESTSLSQDRHIHTHRMIDGYLDT